jgi:hypothetical protein
MSPFFCQNIFELDSHLFSDLSCNENLEANRYPLFILAMNKAFEALREAEGLPLELQMASDDIPLFYRNDPMQIKGIHNEKESIRKPDIVLVSIHSARIAFEPTEYDHGTCDDYAFSTTKPKGNFGWGDVFLTVEFKRSNQTMMKPPLKYKRNKAVESIAPQSLHSTSERDGVADPTSGMYFD